MRTARVGQRGFSRRAVEAAVGRGLLIIALIPPDPDALVDSVENVLGLIAECE